MKSFDREKYHKLGEKLGVAANQLSPHLNEDSQECFEHYLEHGEYEMAFEALVTAAMEERINCSKHISHELLYLGTELDMETEAVFDFYFWSKAKKYLDPENSSD